MAKLEFEGGIICVMSLNASMITAAYAATQIWIAKVTHVYVGQIVRSVYIVQGVSLRIK